MRSNDCDVGISTCSIILLAAGVVVTSIFIFIARHILKQKHSKTTVSSSSPHTNTNNLPDYVEYAEELSDLDEIQCATEEDTTISNTTNQLEL